MTKTKINWTEEDKVMIKKITDEADSVTLKQIAVLEEAAIIAGDLGSSDAKYLLKLDIEHLESKLTTKRIHKAPDRRAYYVDIATGKEDKTAIVLHDIKSEMNERTYVPNGWKNLTEPVKPGDLGLICQGGTNESKKETTFLTLHECLGMEEEAAKIEPCAKEEEVVSFVTRYDRPPYVEEKRSTRMEEDAVSSDYEELSDEEAEHMERLLKMNGNNYDEAIRIVMDYSNISTEEPSTTVEDCQKQANEMFKGWFNKGEDDDKTLYIDEDTKLTATEIHMADKVIMRKNDGTEEVIKDRSGRTVFDSTYNPVALLEDHYFPIKDRSEGKEKVIKDINCDIEYKERKGK